MWNEADIINVSNEEVKFLTNGGDEKMDEILLTSWHDNLKLLVVTDGPKGCRYYTPRFKGHVNSFQVLMHLGVRIRVCQERTLRFLSNLTATADILSEI